MMSQFRVRAAAVVLATSLALTGGLGGGLTIAIGSSPAHAQSTSTISSTADEVKEWSRKKWNAMKREWKKDKAKWNSCNDKAGDKKLSGKASWSFIYDCMKAS